MLISLTDFVTQKQALSKENMHVQDIAESLLTLTGLIIGRDNISTAIPESSVAILHNLHDEIAAKCRGAKGVLDIDAVATAKVIDIKY